MTKDDDLWGQDDIQFPRLLAEIRAIGLSPHQYTDLQDAMDVEGSDIDDLLERAETAWQEIKERHQEADVDELILLAEKLLATSEPTLKVEVKNGEPTGHTEDMVIVSKKVLDQLQNWVANRFGVTKKVTDDLEDSKSAED